MDGAEKLLGALKGLPLWMLAALCICGRGRLILRASPGGSPDTAARAITPAGAPSWRDDGVRRTGPPHHLPPNRACCASSK